MIYAVNKRTKIHRRDDGMKTDDERWVEADADGWIEWPGGECPLPDDAGVRVKTNIGIRGCGRAYEFRWARQSRHGDIIAYRPILYDDTKPEPPAWDGEGARPPAGVPVESKHKDATPEWANPDFHETTIVAMGKHLAIFTHPGSDHETVGRIDDYEFRPIRSEEDRITEELERIMYKPAMTREMAARIYEAIRDGKVPGVKLEGSS